MCDKMNANSNTTASGRGTSSASTTAPNSSAASLSGYPHSVAPSSEAGSGDHPWQNYPGPAPPTIKARSTEVEASTGLTAAVERENMLFTRLGLGSLGAGSFLAKSSACGSQPDTSREIIAGGSQAGTPQKPSVGYRPSRPLVAGSVCQSVTSTAPSSVCGDSLDASQKKEKKERKSAAMHAIEQGQELLAHCATWTWSWPVWNHHRTVRIEHQK